MAGVIPLNVYNGDTARDRSNSPTDQRHRGTANFVWRPKPLPDDSALARYIVNGWEFSALGSYASGEPVTALALPVGQQFSQITMVYTSTLDGFGGWNRVPFVSAGTLKTATDYTVDARITRTLPFTDRVKGMVMFEGFNLFNRQPATVLNTIAYTATTSLPPGAVSGPTSGVLRPVLETGTGIGSLGYPDGTRARRFQVAFKVVF